MRPNNPPTTRARQIRRLLAIIPAVAFVAAALIFAVFLPSQTESGNAEGLRWFAFSAFPLAVVVCIAAFTRFQRKLDQTYGKPGSERA